MNCSNSQTSQLYQKSNDLTEYELKGPVKLCKSAEYYAVDVNGRIAKGEFVQNNFHSEWKIKSLHFRPNGQIDEYSYFDEKENLVRSDQNIFNDKDLIIKELSIRHYGSLRSIDSTFNYYNSANKLVKHEWFIGQYHGLRRYTYDSRGFLIADSTFDPIEKLSNYNIWKNDEKGNVLENIYHIGYKLFSRTYNDYNKQNLLIYSAVYYPNEEDSEPLIKKFEYNSKNQIAIELILGEDKQVLEKTVYTYFPNGLLQKSIVNYYEYEDTSITTYQYEYDNKGNWIKKITYNENKPIYIDEREISYYK